MNTTTTPDRIWNPVQRDAVTFLEPSASTGGARTVALLEVAPGGQVTPHSHNDYTESFRVVEGELTVTIDGRVQRAESGDEATVSAGAVHSWRNDGSATALAEVTLIPGQPGFELALRVAYGLARDGLVMANGMPRNPLHLALLLRWGGGRLAGPLSVLWHVAGPLAWIAERRGIGDELRARYGVPAGG